MATTFVSPQTYPIALSLTLLVGAVVAGLGSLWGILAGALVIQYLPDVAGRLSSEPGVPSVIYGAHADRAHARPPRRGGRPAPSGRPAANKSAGSEVVVLGS